MISLTHMYHPHNSFISVNYWSCTDIWMAPGKEMLLPPTKEPILNFTCLQQSSRLFRKLYGLG